MPFKPKADKHDYPENFSNYPKDPNWITRHQEENIVRIIGKKLNDVLSTDHLNGESMNWYDENIENGIKTEVKLLRDNGFNTECSCDHGMYVQCQYVADGELKRLHDILFNNGYRNYIIHLRLKIIDGFSYSSLQINFNR